MPASKAAETVTAIIVNYNAGAYLHASVASALAQAKEVIVVDNASSDDSLAALADLAQSRLRIVRNSTNLGFAAACNIGARANTTSRLLFLNPDCTLTDGALQILLDALGAEPGIGMVGGHLLYPDGSEQPGGRRAFPTPQNAFAQAFGLSVLTRMFPRLFPSFSQHDDQVPSHPINVEAISGACMLVKAEAIAEIGLWDEGYFLHCEDLDWCKRFELAGWRVLFVPAARILHVKGASKAPALFVEWHKHRGMLRFYRKFYRQSYPLPLMWAVYAGVWLRFGLVAIRSTLLSFRPHRQVEA